LHFLNLSDIIDKRTQKFVLTAAAPQFFSAQLLIP